MLLRRITPHVKDRNWFAVRLDFGIVVIAATPEQPGSECLDYQPDDATAFVQAITFMGLDTE